MLRTERPSRPPLRLGAILAGGRSRRFGSPKPLALLDGISLVERVGDALRAAGARPVLITAPGVPDLRHLFPCREDAVPGLGPLGGLYTALTWASELGVAGALCLACDTPFLPPSLLMSLAEMGEQSPDAVIAPESPGPRGIEPLCAWYPVGARPEIRARLEAKRLSLASLLESLLVRRIPLAEIRALGDPASIFMNINTLADQARAAEIAPGNAPKSRNG